MDQKLLSIGEAAEMLGFSIMTLRRWDASGSLLSVRLTPTGNRYYRKSDLENLLNDPVALARQWVFGGVEDTPPNKFYCGTSDVFNARLQRWAKDLKDISKPNWNLVVMIAGEIGNNSFDHNGARWPDTPGIFFGYSQSQLVLADRGQGVLKTLQRVKPMLHTDRDALKVAFTEMVSGRAPESRGNGLKLVKKLVIKNPFKFYFQTGDAILRLENGSIELDIKVADQSFRGCMAVLNF